MEDAVVTAALLGALDQILPGAADVIVHRALLPSSLLGEVWGRPSAVVRYEVDSREWLGRRGFPHEVGWPGLLAVGEWTHPGRLVSDVVEGAMSVADVIAAAG
jgi:phytoene dehydrogenase-like protein